MTDPTKPTLDYRSITRDRPSPFTDGFGVRLFGPIVTGVGFFVWIAVGREVPGLLIAGFGITWWILGIMLRAIVWK